MVLSNGGVKSKIRSSASRTRFSSSDRSATSTRSESPALEIAAQVCGSESMRASAFSLDPRGVPSSKYARRYHAPSQASASIVCASWVARVRQACASSPSSRKVSNSAKSPSTQISNQASQTLSPLPPSPTRLRPSFQSPPPISGNPCGPAVAACNLGRGIHEGHYVLQLVTEAVSAARLIKGRAAPNPATESLIKQPAVEQKIRGELGRFHFDRAQESVPPLAGFLECGFDVGGIAKTRNEFTRFFFIVRLPDEKSHFCGVSRVDLDRDLHGCAR